MRKIYWIFIISVSSLELKAVDTTAYRYFPMSTGNVYVYLLQASSIGTYKFKASITKDSIFNGHRYYYLNNFYCLYDGWHRTDTMAGSFYRYALNGYCMRGNDELRDSFLLNPGYHNICNINLDISFSQFTLFGVPSVVGSYHYGFGSDGGNRKYVKDFGIYRYEEWGSGGYYSYVTLVGCVINGTVYGDTSYPITNLNVISNEIPKIFMLAQNNPNPFNPVTTIKFSIPPRGNVTASNVKLTIFDITGRLVAVLVNEQLKPANYEIKFDASAYSSGVLFYKLESEGFVDTKKMMIVK